MPSTAPSAPILQAAHRWDRHVMSDGKRSPARPAPRPSAPHAPGRSPSAAASVGSTSATAGDRHQALRHHLAELSYMRRRPAPAGRHSSRVMSGWTRQGGRKTQRVNCSSTAAGRPHSSCCSSTLARISPLTCRQAARASQALARKSETRQAVRKASRMSKCAVAPLEQLLRVERQRQRSSVSQRSSSPRCSGGAMRF